MRCSSQAARVLLWLSSGLLLTTVTFSGPSVAATNNRDTSQPPENEVHIARLIYEPHALSSWGAHRPWRSIDWPEAEAHFTAGVSRLTAIDIAPDSRHIRLQDDAIFDYPWLFVQQVGRWSLDATEAANLREYLLRGGFMLVDDFHGPDQWQVFRQVMSRVLGEFRIEPLASDAAVLNIMFELDQRTAIPGRRHLRLRGSEVVARMPHSPPRWMGIFDSHQRLMVAINFNMDMGDAWEHADDPQYPAPMTSLAYRFGVNYVIYAMTH